MITRTQIEERLRLHMGNLCMATLTKQEGDLTLAKNLLLDAVETIVREAEKKGGQ